MWPAHTTDYYPAMKEKEILYVLQRITPENTKPNPRVHRVCDSTYTKYPEQANPQKEKAGGEAVGEGRMSSEGGWVCGFLLERRERSGMKQL